MGNIVQNDRSNLEKFQCCMEKEEKIPYPIQCGSSVSEYIKMIKLHAISVGEDLDGIEIKVKFICELLLVNTLKNLLSYNSCTPMRQKYADRIAILIFAYNEKENIYAN